MRQQGRIAIVGAGPAGMGCARVLSERGYSPLVIEKDGAPGGLCRTINFNDYLFDIGGHRFLTSSEEIARLWREMVGNDLLSIERLSRIYYRNRYYNYPLSFFNTFANLGPFESFACIADYVRCKYTQPGDDDTFEGWIVNRFGRRLYDIFFKSYTMKVWDSSCEEISSDWAKERIAGLSLKVALQNALVGTRAKTPKTLCDSFLYPRRGPGCFFEHLERAIRASGGEFLFSSKVVRVRHEHGRIETVMIKDTSRGTVEEIECEALFSSTPLPELVTSLLPPPQHVLDAARKLRFRSFIAVNVILDKEELFPDQWLYIHEPGVKLARVQNYKNWSAAMVPDQRKTTLGLEYFCGEGDALWEMNDVDLINFALGELERIGIVSRKHLINGFVVRCAAAYPAYAIGYAQEVETVLDYLKGFSNLKMIGRAGLFRYCNSDSALLSGMQSAQGFLKCIFLDKCAPRSIIKQIIQGGRKEER